MKPFKEFAKQCVITEKSLVRAPNKFTSPEEASDVVTDIVDFISTKAFLDVCKSVKGAEKLRGDAVRSLVALSYELDF